MILYGSESWVVTGEMLKILEGLHHRAARWITGMTVTCGAVGEWESPLVVAEMESVGLHPIIEYIRKRKAKIVEEVAWRPIYELCVEAELM